MNTDHLNTKTLSHLWPALLLALLVLAGLSFSGARAQAVVLTPRAYLPLVQRSVPLPAPDAASARLSVPQGFAIRIFAAGLTGRPRLMEIGPDGELYVALFDAGQVVRLPDRNGDGLSDGVEVVVSGLTQPHNLEWYNNYLYVAQTAKIQRFTGPNPNGSYTLDPAFQIDLPSGGGHSTRTLHFGPDGKLYVSVGSSCNACTETDPRRAAILRFNPDGSIPADNPFASDPSALKRPVWATGVRNSVDFTWGPGGALWADQNGSDGLGDNTPPEEALIAIQKGANHGWPYCYTPVLGLNIPPQPEVRDTVNWGNNTFNCAGVAPALYTIQAHFAPLGLGWGPAAIWPAEYRDDLFMALHGSWNTASPSNFRDCKVERILIAGGQVLGSMDFINGWRAPGKLCGDPATYGRPADVVVNQRGEMFISDDKANQIYRVIYIGP
jgi:glucose/arabinose dehydrogenase